MWYYWIETFLWFPLLLAKSDVFSPEINIFILALRTKRDDISVLTLEDVQFSG